MAGEIDEAGLCALFLEINEIADKTIRKGVIDIWLKTARDCRWEQFEDVPKNTGAEKDRRLTDHIRGVTLMPMSLADIAKRLHGTPYNRDYLIAACLLHDVSKPMETAPDPAGKPTNGLCGLRRRHLAHRREAVRGGLAQIGRPKATRRAVSSARRPVRPSRICS